MRVFSSDCTFDYSWEEVSTANWQKYSPWNIKSTHVIAVDTLSRSVDPTSGIVRDYPPRTPSQLSSTNVFLPQLHTERLITCQQTAPAWVLALLGGANISHVHETSFVDPAAKRVTMISTNLTWSNILRVQEKVVYQPDSSSSSKINNNNNTCNSTSQLNLGAGRPPKSLLERTRFTQEAKITALCGGWQKIRTKIEEASVERFGENARKGKEGFEAVLEMSCRVWGEEREKARLAQGG